MTIDFHTHVFPDKIALGTIDYLAKKGNIVPYADGTMKGLMNAMNISDVDMSVVLPVVTKPSQFESINRFAVMINENYGKNERSMISFGGIHPACEDIPGKMKYIKELGLKGVKLHPDYQGTFIDDPGYIKIIECAKDLDLIVVTHAGVDPGYPGEPVKCPPELALKVIKKVNFDKFVLAHYGGNEMWKQVYDVLAGENVWFDTAVTLGRATEKEFRDIYNKHGADRILFASDSPWSDVKKDIEIIKSYNLGIEAEKKIFYENALKLLGE